MFDILTVIPGKKKLSQSGWYSFNAVCCYHNGHKPDKRGRGGIIMSSPNWSYHCFNCGFKCAFVLGKPIVGGTKKLLRWCGIDDLEIQRWSLESIQNQSILDLITHHHKKPIEFSKVSLPDGSEDLDENNPKHERYISYLKSRGIKYDSYPFKVTLNKPDEKFSRKEHRIIVPYFFKDEIVGYTSRFLDNKLPKYINNQQPGYVFNIDAQHKDWTVCIVTEGIFDALSIDGVALMHDDISDDQHVLLSSLNRQIIVVPDQDKTGLKITDRALELGYTVSLPNWGDGIKDTNDAVVRYGKLPTLLSILESATSSKIKIEMRKKKIGQRL